MKKVSLSIKGKRIMEAYVFMIPFIIGVSVLFAFPMFISVKLSFGKLVSMVGYKIDWVGFDSYIRAFTMDPHFIPMFLEVIKQTLVKGPLIIVFSLIIAIVLNKNIKFRGFFRTVAFLPFLLGSGYVMQQLLGQNVNVQTSQSAQSFYIPPEILDYLGPGVSAAINSFFGNIVVVLWSSGVQILLFLSGLQSIPASLYESAKIDSATEWEMFWFITLPMLSPIMLLNIVFTLVDTFINIHNPILDYIKQIGFQLGQYEYAAAIGWIYFIFVLMLVLIVFAATKKYIYASDMGGVAKNDNRNHKK